MIAIIDYNAGNLRSVVRALRHLALDCAITRDRDELISAERVIFPGVGAAGRAMDTIKAFGIDEVIEEVVARGTPFLGICLGTQIILDESEEDNAKCLGIMRGAARKFPEMGEKIPHMGWNTLTKRAYHPIFHEIDPDAQFYFVHSYYPSPTYESEVLAETTYGISFASAIARDNVVATQFHPEKSGRFGLKMLENFSRWDGKI
jgi:glutamine amidotransferase